ncbi:P-type E1-E2 ATPase/heavy metal translocating P-type ATPase [Modicisalibacter xianhensis]|uniref:P-type Zn(2+) transporter n=1 Tax=Modicisalibacter xianhensis TaxID=442341 RepID=A0A4R8G6X5_9GAMM|nr:heavy metal translocating P-type ATPase [Halomonas xianhensis]TDX31069.1 P-type E1-E2 ATPase/heavy metal translocating P-type ATPase [Halomonas xianhensis]
MKQILPLLGRLVSHRQSLIALVVLLAIITHLLLRFGLGYQADQSGVAMVDVPLLLALAAGIPLLFDLAKKLAQLEFGADLLAGLSILTALWLDEYLAGALIVLMLSGGQALEGWAVRRASFALEALANRMPSVVHRFSHGQLEDVALDDLAVGEVISVYPHETCPVDGIVLDGQSTMNEAYLTGEPFLLPKAVGANVISGSINGEGRLTVQATSRAVDSRYAKIMQVMRESEQRRPRLRRLGDRIGALYTPLALGIALLAWGISGDPVRFLSVLVVATPCPLLLAIPVAVIGSVSLAARRGIVIRNPGVLEQIATCRVAIFDKTGTLTYGHPTLTDILVAPGMVREDVLAWVASLERYSRHPLAVAILAAARKESLTLSDAEEVSERPGEGLKGRVAGKRLVITGRSKLQASHPELLSRLPAPAGGLECVVLVDDTYAGLFRLRDEPRLDGRDFVHHLSPLHGFERVMIVSGDRESEVRYLADKIGIVEVHAGQSPEQKLALVRKATRDVPTLFMGDGTNDAPALTAATVGIAFGQGSEVASEAADAVVLDSSLARVDELLHIGRRMRAIALQSALGGMGLSLAAVGIAAMGYLPPVNGAILQEVIDILAVVNALRAALTPRHLSDLTNSL